MPPYALLAAWLATAAPGGAVAPPIVPAPPSLEFAAAVARAASAQAPVGDAREPPALTATFGVLEAFDSEHQAAGGFELRMPEVAYEVQPMLGMAYVEDGSLYAYAGLRWNLELGAGWRLAPGFAVGRFDGSDVLDLGSSLEFRSSLEVSRALGERSRLGFELYHLSNSSIDDTNPGTEGLVLNWSYALD